MKISHIRLSDKTSRLHPRHVVPKPAQAHEPEVPVKVREWIRPALASPDLVGIDRRAPKLAERVNSVGQQAADFSEETGPIDSRDTVASSQQSNLRAMANREGIRYHDQATI